MASQVSGEQETEKIEKTEKEFETKHEKEKEFLPQKENDKQALEQKQKQKQKQKKRKYKWEEEIHPRHLALFVKHKDKAPAEMFELLEAIDMEFAAFGKVASFFEKYPKYQHHVIFPLLFNKKRNDHMKSTGVALESWRLEIEMFQQLKDLTDKEKGLFFQKLAAESI
jgi:hypothetical protein